MAPGLAWLSGPALLRAPLGLPREAGSGSGGAAEYFCFHSHSLPGDTANTDALQRLLKYVSFQGDADGRKSRHRINDSLARDSGRM